MQTTDRTKKIQYLEGYRWSLENIKMLRFRVDALNDRLYKVKNQVITDMPRGGKSVDVVDIMSDKFDIEEEVLHRIELANIKRKEILSVIDAVEDPRYRMILEMRYIDGTGLNTIAELLGYSYTHMCRLHSEAIDSVNVK